MKTLYQLFAFIFLSSLVPSLNAQEASRFPILPTSVWRINYEYACNDYEFVHENGDMEYKYFIDGDTLINGHSYFKLFKTGIMFLDTQVPFSHQYVGAIRDSLNRFYWVEKNIPTEILLYDFDAKVGDPICPDCDGVDYTVSEIVTLDDGRKQFNFDIITVHCGSANSIVEGIGWLGGLLEGNSCYSHPGVRGSYLLCYSENSTSVYESEAMHRCGAKMNCDDISTNVKDIYRSDAPEITYLPGRQLEICLASGNSGFYDVEFFTLQGKKLNQVSVNLPAVVDVQYLQKGSYIVRVSKGMLMSTEKFIIP